MAPKRLTTERKNTDRLSLACKGTYAIVGNPEENCDVIHNGAEKVNDGTKKHGSAFACVHRHVITGNPED